MDLAIPLPVRLLAAGSDPVAYVQPVIFAGLAALVLGSAVVAATAPRIVHAGFGLLGAFFGVAGIYALLGADFLALTQILVYVGGILVLLVFAILLTQRVQGRLGLEERPRLLLPSIIGGVVFAGLLAGILSTSFDTQAPEDLAAPEPTTAALGRALIDPEQYLVPFELASVLLLAALVGAAYLVRRRRNT